VKVGDLVRHKRTGKVAIVATVFRLFWDRASVAVTVTGFPSNQIHDTKEWELISESR
jgi:hypothetical protein